MVKVRAIQRESDLKKRFFLLMIAPLLIGLMISLTNFAHADWKGENDPRLNQSPSKQGWKQIQTIRSWFGSVASVKIRRF